MQLQARLVHAEPGTRVVEVSALRNGELLGSALGEGATAEAAEDRALARLQQRLPAAPTAVRAAPSAEPPLQPPAPTAAPAPAPTPTPTPTPASPGPAAPAPLQAELLAGMGEQPAAAAPQPELVAEPPPDPEDWSSELTQLDLELRRLGWQRDQEATYLERAFGHPSRSRLTSYSDLVAYLQALQALAPASDPSTAPVPLRRRDLLSQCDQLLGQLQWDAARGRQFLEHHFQLNSRQQLSDSQLLQFNMLLEGELIGV